MSLEIATCIYSFLVASVFVGIWVYYDRRDHAHFEAERILVSFHCAECGRIYTHNVTKTKAVCPSCNRENTHIS